MFRDRGTDMSFHYEFKKEIYDPETLKGKYRMKRFVRILAEYLDAPKGKALDIGCAMGISTFALEQFDYEPIGIDTSKSFILIAKDISTKKKLKSRFYVKKATEIESLKQMFNVVTFMGNPLPHFSIDELDTTIRKCWNVLNIDGVILFHYQDWIARLFSSYQHTFVETNRMSDVMISYHSALDTNSGEFERIFMLPKKGEFFKVRFNIWSPWILEFLLKNCRFKNIESHKLEEDLWVTRAVR
jgi:MPBQ/MSBQ methyltransferase